MFADRFRVPSSLANDALKSCTPVLLRAGLSVAVQLAVSTPYPIPHPDGDYSERAPRASRASSAVRSRSRVQEQPLVIVRWRGLLVCAEIIDSGAGHLTLRVRGFVPLRGSRITVRRVGSFSSGTDPGAFVWYVHECQTAEGGTRHLLLRRNPLP